MFFIYLAVSNIFQKWYLNPLFLTEKKIMVIFFLVLWNEGINSPYFQTLDNIFANAVHVANLSVMSRTVLIATSFDSEDKERHMLIA